MTAHTTTAATFGGDVANLTSPLGVITSMLKEYLPYELLFEELMQRDYLLSKVAKDQSWKGGELSVPFMGGAASSFAYGELTDVADITEDRPVRGKVDEFREIWGTMVFHQKDLDGHSGGLAQSFLKILPDRLEDFIMRMKEAVSVNLLNGQHYASYDSGSVNNNLAAGIVAVDRIARFQIGQYVTLGNVDESTSTGEFKFQGYIDQIDISAKTIRFTEVTVGNTVAIDVFSTANSAPDLSVDPGNGVLAAGDKIFLRGALGDPATATTVVGATNTVRRGFSSLRSQLLSAANGGSSTAFGISKLQYPHLQALNFDGSAINVANLLDQVFDFYNESRTNGKGAPTEVIMSYKNLGAAMKQLSAGLIGTSALDTGATSTAGTPQRLNAGGFSAGIPEANAFGWTTIKVTGVQGSLTLVGVQEMDDDIMMIMDWRALKLHSNGFFERRQSPEGREYFEVRNTSGYKYVIDTRFYGELVLSKPSHCGIIHSISF